MQSTDDIGKLIIRLVLGAMVFLHGLNKLMTGATGIVALVTEIGWPSWIAYGVFIGEAIAPALIIIGVFTRFGGFAIAVDIVVAVYLRHTSQLLQMTDSGGWRLELQAMFLATAVAVMFLGAGRFSLGGSRGVLN